MLRRKEFGESEKKRKEMTNFLAEATQDDLFIATQQELVSLQSIELPRETYE